MRTITVIDTSVIKSGTSSSGKPWTLYEVVAVNQDGAPIDEKLKSFDELKPGPVQVEIERQDDEKFGTSFMLKLPRGSEGSNPPPAGARLGPKVDALEERLKQLEIRVEQLERPLPSDGQPYGQERRPREAPPKPPAAPSGAMF